MKTILVPTDFSKLSKVAVSYAIGLAKKMNARIFLLSVINASDSEEGLTSFRKMQQDMIRTAQRDADKMLAEISEEKGSVSISYKQALGFPVVDEIEKYAVANKINLIVMSSKGASGLRKILVGSNAAAVIDKSSVPVIVVPEKAKFISIKKLVYATDGKHFQKEAKIAAECAAMVGAALDVLHVIPQGDFKKGKGDVVKTSKEKLINALKDPAVKVHVVTAKTVVEGVNDFALHHKADLLAMFTHQLDFKEKLLGRSVTRAVALGLNLPMLTFNRNK